MGIGRDSIIYNTDLDYLDIQVDKKQCSDVFISSPTKNLKLTFNADTGGLLQIMILNFYDNIKSESEGIEWEMDSDTLVIKLTNDNRDMILCDLIWSDSKMQSMITLGRNEVGNLMSIELINVHKLVQKFSV
tara:strand:+ start:195 stop:590 length:396 start_codon:yes stop_codon:yes gene_type:complete